MLKAQIGKELVVDVPNEVGVLAKLAKVVSEKGVNILAMCANDTTPDNASAASSTPSVGRSGQICLLTDNNLRASEALAGHGYAIQERSVVTLDAANRPGILLRLAETLAGERINIHRLYGSSKLSQQSSLIVLDTEDNKRAVILLND